MILLKKRLLEVLKYDPETGHFIWLPRHESSRYVRSWNGRYDGKRAGCIKYNYDVPNNYLLINVDDRLYRAHRLAFLYMTGELPRHGVDHHDGNGLNNRWENLRPADQSQNIANSRIRSDSTTGLKGVSFHKLSGRYRAHITVHGKHIHLGLFDTTEAAYAAHVCAANKYFGEFTRSC